MAELKSWLEGHAVTFELIDGRNSVFRVACNGKTVFDRETEGRFPLYHEIQLRVFRMFLKPENLKDATQQKWNRILQAEGLTWNHVFMK